MDFYLKGAPCLVKGLIICCYKPYESHLCLILLASGGIIHSSIGFGWLRPPYKWRASPIAPPSMLSILFVSSFIFVL